VLISLYGPQSPINVSLAYSRPGVIVALLFVTLPFVVRTVQPVLMELDPEMEQAAASLGASRFTIFRRIVLPNLMPAILAGAALSFCRAISEYGSTVLISGNIPFKTQVASVHIYNQIENDNTTGAAAVATVLLVVALVVLFGISLLERRARRVS
jgi:sulfate/thiosulfate transport system permease protein